MVVELYCKEWSPVQELCHFDLKNVLSSVLDCWRCPSNWRMLVVYGACVDLSSGLSVKMVRQKLLICGTIQDLNILWQFKECAVISSWLLKVSLQLKNSSYLWCLCWYEQWAKCEDGEAETSDLWNNPRPEHPMAAALKKKWVDRLTHDNRHITQR